MDDAGNQGGSDLRAVVGMLRRRLWVIVLAAVVGAGVAYAVSELSDPSYESTTVLLFRPLQLPVQLTGLPLEIPSDAARDATTNQKLVSLESVRAAAAARLGGGVTADTLKDDVTVTLDGESELVNVTGKASTPAQAMRIADAVASAYVAQSAAQVRRTLRTTIEAVRQQVRETSPNAKASQAAQAIALRRLLLLEATSQGDVRVVQSAQPPDGASSPRTVLSVVLGGILGMIVGVALALAIEQFDRRLRGAEQVEAALELPLLASVPKSKALRAKAPWQRPLPAAEAEAFKRLRANLRGLPGGRELRTVLVTSPSAESGKTTVALRLAAAAAASGQRVSLIEADLRRPRLQAMLGAEPGAGLSDVLGTEDGGGGTALPWLTVDQPGTHVNGAVPTGRFRVLMAGGTPEDAGELLDSVVMEDVLRRAREESDLVVIDSPPPGLVSDAIPLLGAVDGVLVVSRLGRDSREDLSRLSEQLARLGAPAVGAVATFTPSTENPYLKGR